MAVATKECQMANSGDDWRFNFFKNVSFQGENNGSIFEILIKIERTPLCKKLRHIFKKI